MYIEIKTKDADLEEVVRKRISQDISHDADVSQRVRQDHKLASSVVRSVTAKAKGM